jgi:hypothetical protein
VGALIKFMTEALIIIFVLIPLGIVGLIFLWPKLRCRLQDRREPISPGVQVHRWTQREPNRIRTFEKTTQRSSGGRSYVEISCTRELATSRQIQFLRQLGFNSEGLDLGEARALIDRALRPVNYALSQTFKKVNETLSKEDLRGLQVALAKSELCRHLPRYGPHSTLADLEASGDDPHRRLTKEERMAVTEIAFQVLPSRVFDSLESKGVGRYKAQLGERRKTDGPPMVPSQQVEETLTNAGVSGFKLETEKSRRFGDVTEELLRKVFGDERVRGEFVVLSKDSQIYIQTRGNGEGPYCLEYRDGDAEHHFQAGDKLRREEVLRAFLWYLADDPRWRTDFPWRKLEYETS